MIKVMTRFRLGQARIRARAVPWAVPVSGQEPVPARLLLGERRAAYALSALSQAAADTCLITIMCVATGCALDDLQSSPSAVVSSILQVYIYCRQVKYLEVVDIMVGQLLRRLAEAEQQVRSL